MSHWFNGDEVGRDVGVAEVHRHHEEDDEDRLSLGPAGQLEVGQGGEPVVLGGDDCPGQRAGVRHTGLRHREQTWGEEPGEKLVLVLTLPTGRPGGQDGEARQTEGGVGSSQASRSEDVSYSGLSACVHDDLLLLLFLLLLLNIFSGFFTFRLSQDNQTFPRQLGPGRIHCSLSLSRPVNAGELLG